MSYLPGRTDVWFLLAVLGVVCSGRAQAVDPQSYVVAWGRFGYDTRSREARIVKVSCGWNNTAHLRVDGRLFVQGSVATIPGSASLIEVPPLPAGVTYTDVSLSRDNIMAVRSDGNAIGWGRDTYTQQALVAPPLPAGLYVGDWSGVAVPVGPCGFLLGSNAQQVGLTTDTAGIAEFSIPVQPGLVHLQLGLQAVLLVPPGPSVVMSNGLRVTIGGAL